MNNPNHRAATEVLPREGWATCGVTGRPLEHEDLAALQKLGVEDPNFAWERSRQSPAYFANLLRFRIDHYRQHSFGVHGVWVGENLVGQLGLQSLDAGTDRVEFAIFLGGPSRHRGLGKCLTRYLIERSTEAGIGQLWAAVRPDNPEGLKLVAGIGMQPQGSALHFGQVAEFFSVDLGRG